MTTKSNWKGKVYKKVPRMSFEDKENWRKLRRFILDRDSQTCARCDKHFRAQRDLSVHHILPRADGGKDDPTNLITLCHPCHDYVEINCLKTSAEIIGSYDDGTVKVVELPEKADREETFVRPGWHKFVYGGVRKSI